MPKLWNETIDAHRRAVRDATLDATAALVAEHGLQAVTMSQIAEKTGIGRATLYKYFPDVEAILVAWHERHVIRHLEHLAAVRDQAGRSPVERLHAVLEAFALIAHERHDGELASLLHRGEHVARAQRSIGCDARRTRVTRTCPRGTPVSAASGNGARRARTPRRSRSPCRSPGKRPCTHRRQCR